MLVDSCYVSFVSKSKWPVWPEKLTCSVNTAQEKRFLEHVKKFTFKQEHLARKRRGAESTKKIKQLCISNLCASASLREIVNFFTGS